MSTGAVSVWDSMYDEDVADGTVWVTDVMVIGMRFANVPNRLVYLRLL
jgi:hypothetical protein